MPENTNRFRTVKFRFETERGTHWERYFITDNYIPFFRINQWLELKSIQKASTGQEYAKKLATFLNWLDSNDVSFEDATNRHVRQSLHVLIFGNLQDGKILSLESTVSSSTIGKYITVITGFYRWLDEVSQTEMLWKSKSLHADNSFRSKGRANASRRCAKRAGLDESKIRTHNGRSTKVMEFLEHQALHPEDNITDGIIMASFGWRSFSSIDHYHDHNNLIIAKAVMEKLHKGGDHDE